ncbi:MAG: HD domain-containing protein [Panacagrimonas sp.]
MRVAYDEFRARVGHLVSRIHVQLPGLTAHDLTHLDALWETADLVVGPGYPLNPLEAFVLGGAILLHDSALCFEAYEGGRAGIRASAAWKDAYAAAADSTFGSEDERLSSADFAAVRVLHAHQASLLPKRGWSSPADGSTLFLIADDGLRVHLGDLIGKIAESHHWSLDEVATGLQKQANPPVDFPRAWQIDAQKVACILRCADALHMDGLRAPDFLHALIKRSGISFAHWQAQNWLGQAGLDQDDTSRLIVTSTKPFDAANSSAWWVAYDAALLAHKEIQSCSALLSERSKGRLRFAVQGIRGVESPRSMSTFIRADGWQPCEAELHVSNVDGIVRKLGGEQLYGKGNSLWVALRELIQNARDAVCSRREMDANYRGRITVRFLTAPSPRIEVEDDGIGMSERVILSSLLDFGTSFWASSLVQSEFPGLRASTFRPIGRFGIGFFSVFMVAAEVVVRSKRFDSGFDETRTLSFPDGLSLRPILTKGRVNGFGGSTRVSLKLRHEACIDPQRISLKRNLIGATEFFAPLHACLSRITAMLDVDVFYEDAVNTTRQIHSTFPPTAAQQADWFRSIALSDWAPESKISLPMSRQLQRLRPLTANGRQIGLAALSVLGRGLGFFELHTVGGLAKDIQGIHRGTFVGVMDYEPNGAQRDADLKSSGRREALTNWATEQRGLLEAEPLNDLEMCYATHALVECGAEPAALGRAVFLLPSGQTIVPFSELRALASRTPIVFFIASYADCVEFHMQLRAVPGHAVFCPLGLGSYLSLKMEGGIPCESCSFAFHLHRTVVEAGGTPAWSRAPSELRGVVNEPLDMLVFSST